MERGILKFDEKSDRHPRGDVEHTDLREVLGKVGGGDNILQEDSARCGCVWVCVWGEGWACILKYVRHNINACARE